MPSVKGTVCPSAPTSIRVKTPEYESRTGRTCARRIGIEGGRDIVSNPGNGRMPPVRGRCGELILPENARSTIPPWGPQIIRIARKVEA